jgi:ribosomal protein L10
MNSQRLKPIPEKKVRAVQTLVGEMKKSRTILLASIKGLPSSQLQEMKKQLRKNATILMPKKNIMKRAIESSGKGALVALKLSLIHI